MGLSIAIAGGIIGITVLSILSIIFSMTGQLYDINSSRTKSVDNQNVVFHTNMTITDVEATSGSQFVNFTLTNTGIEKLWNYDKFDVVINYTANIGGLGAQRTEHFTYLAGSPCGPDGSTGTNNWTIMSISSDYIDPNIINTNEGASICAKLTNPVYSSGTVQVTISSDSGYTKNNYKKIP
jgi:hypothetical protein